MKTNEQIIKKLREVVIKNPVVRSVFIRLKDK